MVAVARTVKTYSVNMALMGAVMVTLTDCPEVAEVGVTEQVNPVGGVRQVNVTEPL